MAVIHPHTLTPYTLNTYTDVCSCVNIRCYIHTLHTYKHTYIQTDRHTDMQTHGRTDGRHIGRRTNEQTDGQTERQIETYMQIGIQAFSAYTCTYTYVTPARANTHVHLHSTYTRFLRSPFIIKGTRFPNIHLNEGALKQKGQKGTAQETSTHSHCSRYLVGIWASKVYTIPILGLFGHCASF